MGECKRKNNFVIPKSMPDEKSHDIIPERMSGIKE
jgi:hypothetical protein